MAMERAMEMAMETVMVKLIHWEKWMVTQKLPPEIH
jgi:hypothetical protein